MLFSTFKRVQFTKSPYQRRDAPHHTTIVTGRYSIMEHLGLTRTWEHIHISSSNEPNIIFCENCDTYRMNSYPALLKEVILKIRALTKTQRPDLRFLIIIFSNAPFLIYMKQKSWKRVYAKNNYAGHVHEEFWQ